VEGLALKAVVGLQRLALAVAALLLAGAAKATVS